MERTGQSTVMPAHKVPLQIDQGATFDKTYTWKAGPPTTAALVDLTGCTALAQFREDIESPLVLMELSSADGRLVLGGPSGTIQFLIPAHDTAALAWESCVYDLNITFPGGRVVRRMAGSAVVSRAVTRA